MLRFQSGGSATAHSSGKLVGGELRCSNEVTIIEKSVQVMTQLCLTVVSAEIWLAMYPMDTIVAHMIVACMPSSADIRW